MPDAPPTDDASPREPAKLASSLKVVAGRARFLAFARAMFKLGCLGAGLWMGSALILGSRVQVPAAVAVPVVMGVWGGLVVAAIVWLRPVFRRQTLRTAAYLVDEALPDTEERMSSAIELAQEKDEAFRGSPELVAVLMRQAEHHAEAMDPSTVVSGGDVFRWFTALCGMAVVWFVLLLVMTPNMLLGLQRTFVPWKATSGLPAPTLEVTPGDAVVAQGQAFTVNLEVKPATGLSLDSEMSEAPRALLTQQMLEARAGTVADKVTAMERTGPRSFRATLENVQQGFSYKVATEAGPKTGAAESRAFTVVVEAVPGVAGMQVVYTYPKYTRLAPRTDNAPSGAIDGVEGTTVRLAVIATQPVKTASIVIDDNGAGAERRALEPVPGQAATYATEFVLKKTTQYRVYLVNEQKRENPDNTARPINVRPDKVPTVALISPMGTTKVRPDDTVPVRFSAEDDFGITAVKAVVQVEGGKETVELPLNTVVKPGDAKIDGDGTFSLAEAIRGLVLPGAKGPKRVTLQVKVTDNREPTAQAGLSEKVLLDLDPKAAPLAQRLDNEATKDLADALKKATRQLQEAEKKLGDLQKRDQGRTLTEAEAKNLADAGQRVAEARKQLAEAAQQAEASRYSDIAKQVRDVSDTQLRRAEEEVVKTQLASDQTAARKASAESARRQVAEGREQLSRIAEHLNDAQRDQPAAQSLEQLADQQKTLAEKMAQSPNDPALREQQKELQKKLDEVIRKNPQLQKPAADAQQSRVKDLDRKLQQIEESQKPLKDSAENQAAAATASDRARELGAKQEELNKQISDFAQKQGEALKQAGGQTPDASRQDSIVKDLNDNRLQEAGTGQKAAASQLEQTAKKLEQLQKRAAGSNSREKADQDAKNAEELKQRAEEVKQAVEKAKADHNPPTWPSDPENRQAKQVAEDIRKKAQQLERNPAAKEQAQNAAKAADAARKAAMEGKGDQAAQGLSDAAGQLQQAAQAAQNAAGPPDAAAQTGAAAAQARKLAEQQKALGEQAGQLSKSQEEAASARSNAASTAERQQQVAERLSEAARDARDLQQRTQGAAQDLSDKAGKAAESLEQAAQAQRDAAQATRNLDSTGASGKQGQSAEQLSEARQALGGSKPQPNAGAPQGGSPQAGGQAAGAKSSAGQAVQSARAAQSEAAKGNAAAAQQAADQLAEASRQLIPGQGDGTAKPMGVGQTGQGSGAAQGSPNGQPGMPGAAPGAPGAPGAAPGGMAGGTGTGNMPGGAGGAAPGKVSSGMGMSNGEQTTEMPKEVKEVGLSPSEWANLPPRMQSELLHSAQQPSPPGYRDMIKNYYSKIARMQGDNEGGTR